MANSREWHEALDEYFFGEHRRGSKRFIFHVDDGVLYEAAKLGGILVSSPDEAKTDFLRAANDAFRKNPLTVGDLTCSKNPDHRPALKLCLLAIQVLAVYDMDDSSEDEYTSAAYWPQFEKLAPGVDRRDLEKMQDDLWRKHFADWINGQHNKKFGRIDLPAPREGSGRYIDLPKSQALLRQIDLKELAAALRGSGWKPGEDIQSDIIRKQLNSTALTGHGRRVWADEGRRELAVMQIRDYIREQWVEDLADLAEERTSRPQTSPSGSQAGRSGSRASRPLDRPDPPPRLRRWLSVSSDRQSGHQFQCGIMTWPDGNERRDGKRTDKSPDQLFGNSDDYLRRPPVKRIVGDDGKPYDPQNTDYLIAVKQPGFGGYFVERKTAAPGDEVIVILLDAERDSWESGLNVVADPGRRPTVFVSKRSSAQRTAAEHLPEDWCAIWLCLKEDLQKEDLQQGELDRKSPWSGAISFPKHKIWLQGGLKLKEHVWLEGAGPRIRVDSNTALDSRPDLVWIDFDQYDLSPDGMLSADVDLDTARRVSEVIVQDARQVSFQVDSGRWCSAQDGWIPQGWVMTPESGWPQVSSLNAADPNRPYVCGPLVQGSWPVRSETGNLLRDVLYVVMKQRFGDEVALAYNQGSPGHELVRNLNRTFASTARGKLTS